MRIRNPGLHVLQRTVIYMYCTRWFLLANDGYFHVKDDFLHVKDGYFIAKDGKAKGAPLIVKMLVYTKIIEKMR
jgi:hypothetical protein